LGGALVVAVLLLGRGPQPVQHVVVSGDTLGRIAQAHGVTVEQLVAWNDLRSDLIQVGQVLLIHADLPVGSAQPAAVRPRGRRVPATGSARSLPPERPCLPPPDPDALEAGDEPSYLASKGLGQGQVEAAMQAFLPGLYGCVPEGEEPDGVLSLEIQVACTGRVATVRVLDDGALPGALVACVQDEARYAAFPPHDLPDGFVFHYPVSFVW
jgi:LysM repeat protein